MIKTIIHTFWESSIVNGDSFLIPTKRGIEQINFLIQFFYFYILVLSIGIFSPYTQLPEWDTILKSQHLFQPVWCLGWLPIANWDLCVRLFLLYFFVSSFIGLVLWKRFKLARIFVFTSFFLYLSLVSSFGKIDHYLHLALIVSFLLIFIPTSTSDDLEKLNLQKLFFGIQTFILLTYFTSGLFKLYGILDQELLALNSALSPDSLALNVGKTSFATTNDNFLQSFILNTPSYLFSVVLVFGYLIEFLSIYVIFKPGLHQLWGLLLIILLHAGILLSVGPDFTNQIFIVGIFILFSPFSKNQIDFITDLSLHSKRVYSKLSIHKNEFIVFYDGECTICNGFLKFISRFNLPNEMRIFEIQSVRFKELVKDTSSLSGIESMVIVESIDHIEKKISIKASGIAWVLSRISGWFWLIRLFYNVFPFVGNYIYDLVVKTRKKTAIKGSTLLTEKMRSIALID